MWLVNLLQNSSYICKMFKISKIKYINNFFGRVPGGFRCSVNIVQYLMSLLVQYCI